MLILGIETSCDETAACLLEADSRGFHVRSHVLATQIALHRLTGGIVPEIAARKQMEAIIPVLEECFVSANIIRNPKSEIRDRFKAHNYNNQNILNLNTSEFDIISSLDTRIPSFKLPDIIAVTQGPGLVTSLRVGVQTAKTLAYIWKVPLIAVNHIEGHLLSALLTEPKEDTRYQIPNTNYQFPALGLIVSGGHTELILMKDYGNYELIGRTRDDAAGEAFDKIARLFGLPYPGGPEISKLAAKGDPSAFDFPRPMINTGNFDFSFSGLKTAVLYTLRDLNIKNLQTPSSNLQADLCASFQQAVIDTLVTKTMRAAETYHVKSIALGGGVAANKLLRDELLKYCQLKSLILHLPSFSYTADNAAMIAATGYFKSLRGEYADWRTLASDPNLRIT